MPSSDLFREIGRIFPTGESVPVLAALRQEPLVWQSLEDAEFLQSALDRAGNQAACWSPARLALLALGDPRPVDALRSEPLALLGPGLQELALQAFQALQRTGKPPATLRDAALLALTLRERRRLTGTWSGLLGEILPRSGQPETLWRAPLAVLYGLVPDPEEMLRSLLAKNAPRAAFDWAVHAQFCQPFSDADHIQAFSRLMAGLPVTYQLTLLRTISLRGRESVAAVLADRLLVGHPAFASLRAQLGSEGLDLSGLAGRALALQQMGAFYQLSGDTAQALSLFNAAQHVLDQWQAGLHLQRLNLHVAASEDGAAPVADCNTSTQLAARTGWLQEDLGAVLVSYPFAGSVIEQVPPEAEGGLLQLKRAALMYEKERAQRGSGVAVARDLARQGAASLLASVRTRGVPFGSDFVYSWKPQDALEILLQLELREEALSLTLALLDTRPVDPALLAMAARINQGLGRMTTAIEYGENLAALEPQEPEWRRELADLWSEAGEWERAYSGWMSVLALANPPLVSDKLSCAMAALRSGRTGEAVDLSEGVLAGDPNNGAAQGLMGQALVAQGKPEEAASYLVRATLLSPETLSPWLALARLQRQMGEPQRALETLRAAVTAVPDAADGHLALSQSCIEAGLLADALPHLKQAFALTTADPRAEITLSALLYGQTLRRLGHTAEARAVLERARSSWNTHPELAYEYALALLDLGEAESALPVLETALRNGLPVLEANLLYARILLGEYQNSDEPAEANARGARMQQADAALRRILEIDPENLEARFLVADILRERGELEQALEAYRALSDMPAAQSPELRWRVQWGLGRTALRLGETDIAMAAIKEACLARPESLVLQRALAEVAVQASLPQQALEAAEAVLQLIPGDVDNLAWYAAFVASLGEGRKAAEALERAVQIEPQRADLIVALAHWQLSCGDLSAARESLAALRNMENVSRADLRRAAHIYLRLEEPAAALECYERALKAEPVLPAGLLYEVAQLYERMGDAEAALELAQRALEETPENLPVLMLQADLLGSLKRPQAALALLERALRIAEADAGGRADSPDEMPIESRRLLSDIHERFTRLLTAEGNLGAALDHAEKALGANQALNGGMPLIHDPAQAGRCYLAAELALALLQNERAVRLVRTFSGDEPFPLDLLDQGQDGMELYSLRLEMALANAGDALQAADLAAWVEEALGRAPEDARLLAARARCLARQGNLAAARPAFEAARKAQRRTGSVDTHWMAEAALDVEAWRDAVDLFERCSLSRLNDARAQLGLARALVLGAERQRLSDALGCRTNAPGPDALSEMRRQKFEDAIRAASRLANVGEVGRWQSRGHVAFTPTAQNARALAAMPLQADDSAALIAALRALNNRATAVQVAKRFADHPQVLLQLAACYLNEPSADGVSAAERAVAAGPYLPLAHAALGMLARATGDQARALECYETALTTWPDEPAWHDAAGDLCILAGNLQAGILHRKQAVTLDGNHPRYAFKLGQALLADQDITDATGYLERSVELDAGQAEVWLVLASAYHMAGKLSQSMEAAKKASQLEAAEAEGLLIAGEAALSMDQPEMALEFARDANRREPENSAAVLFLSNVLVLLERAEEGLAVIESASPAVKAVFPVAFERARLIRRLHGSKAALDILEKLSREYPEEPNLLGFLARTEAECGEMKDAEAHAFKALKLDPNQPELTLMLGRLQRKTGQLDQAVHLLSEAVRMMPENLDIYLELGSVYAERREILLALQIYRQAMRIAPGDYQPYYQSGLLLRDNKDYPAAESMLRKAAELAPENLSIRRQLVGVIALNLVHNKQEASVP